MQHNSATNYNLYSALKEVYDDVNLKIIQLQTGGPINRPAVQINKIIGMGENNNNGENIEEEELEPPESPSRLIQKMKVSIQELLNERIGEGNFYDPKKFNYDTMSCTSDSRIEPPSDYEEMLQKFEADIRNHIRIELQLKLHIDSVTTKSEEVKIIEQKMKTENQKLEEEIKMLKNQITKKEVENSKVKRDIHVLRDKSSKSKSKLEKLEKYQNIKAIKPDKSYKTERGTAPINNIQTSYEDLLKQCKTDRELAKEMSKSYNIHDSSNSSPSPFKEVMSHDYKNLMKKYQEECSKIQKDIDHIKHKEKHKNDFLKRVKHSNTHNDGIDYSSLQPGDKTLNEIHKLKSKVSQYREYQHHQPKGDESNIQISNSKLQRKRKGGRKERKLVPGEQEGLSESILERSSGMAYKEGVVQKPKVSSHIRSKSNITSSTNNLNSNISTNSSKGKRESIDGKEDIENRRDTKINQREHSNEPICSVWTSYNKYTKGEDMREIRDLRVDTTRDRSETRNTTRPRSGKRTTSNEDTGRKLDGSKEESPPSKLKKSASYTKHKKSSIGRAKSDLRGAYIYSNSHVLPTSSALIPKGLYVGGSRLHDDRPQKIYGNKNWRYGGYSQNTSRKVSEIGAITNPFSISTFKKSNSGANTAKGKPKAY